MGLDLSTEQVATLEARTEGWIAGLQLAALSLRGRADVDSFVESFSGSHHFVLDYLLEEVVQRQSDRVQAFLVRTSILAQLSGALCDAVLQEPAGSAQATLEELERANLLRNGQNRPHVAFIECEGGYGGANHSENVGDGPVWLRMERKGSRILAAISSDGRSWKSLRPIDTLWPERLKVGLSVVSTSSSPFQVQFEEYDFRPSASGPRGVVTPPNSAPPRPAGPLPGAQQPSPNTYLPPAPVVSPQSSGSDLSRTVLIVVSLVLVIVAIIIIIVIVLAIVLMKKPAQPRRRAKSSRRHDDDYDGYD